MPEPFSFAEGTLHVWTGAATASGSALAYVHSARFAPAWGWQSDLALDGSAYEHLTGQRAALAFTFAHTSERALALLAQTTALLHFKLTHSGLDGSAGYIAWSGRVDRLEVLAAPESWVACTVEAHAPTWSAF